jgi:hypothetical protein
MATDIEGMDPITYWDSQINHWLGKARNETVAGHKESAQAARLVAGMAALNWLELRVDEEGPHLMPPDIQEQLDSEQVAKEKDKVLARVHHRACAELLALKVSRPEV